MGEQEQAELGEQEQVGEGELDEDEQGELDEEEQGELGGDAGKKRARKKPRAGVDPDKIHVSN